jgi:phenylacetic acid degradation operon negative regulatory protein
LAWEGFGAIAAGVYARPARPGQTAPAEIVGALDRSLEVVLLRGREAAPAAAVLESLLRQYWDLVSLDAGYRRFIGRFRRVVELFRDDPLPDPGQCFVVRTLLIHEYRRVTLHDPQLPPAMLPARWHARDAYALCRDFYRLTHRCAEQHLAATLETGSGPLPRAAPYFYPALRRPGSTVGAASRRQSDGLAAAPCRFGLASPNAAALPARANRARTCGGCHCCAVLRGRAPHRARRGLRVRGSSPGITCAAIAAPVWRSI